MHIILMNFSIFIIPRDVNSNAGCKDSKVQFFLSFGVSRSPSQREKSYFVIGGAGSTNSMHSA